MFTAPPTLQVGVAEYLINTTYLRVPRLGYV